MFPRIVTSFVRSRLIKSGVDLSKIVFANGSEPILFSNKQFPVIGGLVYCSGLILSPHDVVNDERFSLGIHIEAVENDISSYRIDKLIESVKDVNGCEVVAADLFGRHFISTNNLSSYASCNIARVEDDLLRCGVDYELITRKQGFENNILVNGEVVEFPSVLYQDMFVNKYQKPNSSIEPVDSLRLPFARPSQLPIFTYKICDKDDKINVTNIFDCVVVALRSKDSDKYVALNINYMFDCERSEQLLEQSIAEISSLCTSSSPKIDAEVYCRYSERAVAGYGNLDVTLESLVARSIFSKCTNGSSSTITIDRDGIREEGVLDKILNLRGL